MIPSNYFTVIMFCPFCDEETNHFIDFHHVDYKKKLIYTYASCEICENSKSKDYIGCILYWDIKDFNSVMPKLEGFRN